LPPPQALDAAAAQEPPAPAAAPAPVAAAAPAAVAAESKVLQVMGDQIPSGKLTVCYMENHHSNR